MKIFIHMLLVAISNYYRKPDPFNAVFYTIWWVIDPNKYYLLLSVSQYYCETTDIERKAMVKVLYDAFMHRK